MLGECVCELSCGHKIKLIAVPPMAWISIMGTDQAYDKAIKETIAEAKQFACAVPACRVRTRKATHPSL